MSAIKIGDYFFLPPTEPSLCFLSAQKPKGGPLEEKKKFQKSSQINTRIGLKIPNKYFRNKNMFKTVFWTMQPLCKLRARWLPTEQTVHGACTGLHGPKYNVKHVFISKIFCICSGMLSFNAKVM